MKNSLGRNNLHVFCYVTNNWDLGVKILLNLSINIICSLFLYFSIDVLQWQTPCTRYVSRGTVILCDHVDSSETICRVVRCSVCCREIRAEKNNLNYSWHYYKYCLCNIFYVLSFIARCCSYCDMFRFGRTIFRQYTYNFTKIIVPKTDQLFWGLIDFL
jgi:hypothetical protein